MNVIEKFTSSLWGGSRHVQRSNVNRANILCPQTIQGCSPSLFDLTPPLPPSLKTRILFNNSQVDFRTTGYNNCLGPVKSTVCLGRFCRHRPPRVYKLYGICEDRLAMVVEHVRWKKPSGKKNGVEKGEK